MIVLQFLLLIFWMLVLPFFIGLNLNRLQKEDSVFSYSKTFFAGFFFALTSFQLLSWLFTYMKGSLTVLTILWFIINVGMAILGILYYKDKPEQILKKKRPKLEMDGSTMVFVVVAICLILFQVIYVTLHVHEDLDDAWYVGVATTSYFTDTINQISPYTGELMQAIPIDYILSPWPIFCAMMGILSGCHPTIIMHTLVPIILIPMAYLAAFLLATILFKKDYEKLSRFMCIFCVFNIFGNYSIRSTSTFLLFRIWQGKAVLCNIIIPLIVYFYILMIEEQNKRDVICLFGAVTTGTMFSSMGVFLIPILLAALLIVEMIMNRNIKNCFLSFVCMIPCLIQLGVYALMRW